MTTRSDVTKPNHSWPWTTPLRCPSLCDVQLHVSPPVYHGCGGRTREACQEACRANIAFRSFPDTWCRFPALCRGGRKEGSVGQPNAAAWTKRIEPPWSKVGLFIHSLLRRSSSTGISIIGNFTVFDDLCIIRAPNFPGNFMVKSAYYIQFYGTCIALLANNQGRI